MDNTATPPGPKDGTSPAGLVTVDAWTQFPWLRAGFSTRRPGGTTVYSDTGWGELNLGWTDADDPAIVARNRQQLIATAAGGAAMELVTLRQVHGSLSHRVQRGAGPLATPKGRAILQGDGLLTGEAGLLLGIQTADCVPVLVADTRTRAVAAFHAGWRGTAARIVEQGISRMQIEFGSDPADLIAAIGPAIRACCFEVGEAVREPFQANFRYAAELFSGPPHHLDLHEANRRQLLDAGLRPEAITLIAECSACARLNDGSRKYFSHRAEHGLTGRMLSVVGTVDPG